MEKENRGFNMSTKKERYQINIRIRRENRKQIDSLIQKTKKNLTTIVLEGIDLFEKKFEKKYKISSNNKA